MNRGHLSQVMMVQLNPSLVSCVQSRWVIAATYVTVTLSKCTQVMISVGKVRNTYFDVHRSCAWRCSVQEWYWWAKLSGPTKQLEQVDKCLHSDSISLQILKREYRKNPWRCLPEWPGRLCNILSIYIKHLENKVVPVTANSSEAYKRRNPLYQGTLTTCIFKA